MKKRWLVLTILQREEGMRRVKGFMRISSLAKNMGEVLEEEN